MSLKPQSTNNFSKNKLMIKRIKPQALPIQINSPEEDLCEISMLYDQHDMGITNFKTPFQDGNKQYKFDGWIKNQGKTHQNFPSFRSHVIENVSKNEKIELENNKSISSKFNHSRIFFKQENHYSNSKNMDEDRLRRAQSHDFGKNILEISQESKQMSLSDPIFNSSFAIRKNITSSRDGSRPDKNIYRRVSVEAVNYPILSISQDPYKKIAPQIGRVRHLINLKTKRKY